KGEHINCHTKRSVKYQSDSSKLGTDTRSDYDDNIHWEYYD
ncbi:45418_t:CDS:1, partial [Gigaspora margarita]